MSFLIGSLKEKFDFEDNEDHDPESFNYKVGNTSGMDVTADIPSEIAQRVGQLAQRGGSVMEIKLENPTTFFIDRQALFETIDGLGLDVSFHSDPNVGYTASYKTGRGRGFDITHDYFTKYIQNYGSFKKEMEERDNLSFKSGRINPHISTDNLPPLHERMADDVSLDPFGYKITELSEEVVRKKSDEGKNIYDNKEFLRRLYYTFLLEEVDYDFQYYNLFSRYSNKFEDEWEMARRDATNEYYRFKTDPENGEVDGIYESLESKISVIRTASQSDRGIDTVWFTLLKDHGEFEGDVLEIDFSISREDGVEYTTSKTTEDLEVGGVLAQGREEALGLNRLPNRMYTLNERPKQALTPGNGDIGFEEYSESDFVEIDMPDMQDLDEEDQREVMQYIQNNIDSIVTEEGIFEENKEAIQEQVIEALDTLWTGNGEERMSIDAKIQALNSHFDVQQMKIQELAYELETDDEGDDDSIEDHAEKVLMGEPEYFEEEGPEEKMDVDKHGELLRNLISANFEQQIWMESNIFYRVIPAWMTVADEEFDGHEGFNAPKFIWETIVERRWGDEYDLDLRNPRADEGEDPKYLDLLEENREFRMDVAAASAAVYFWAHFTQIEDKFQIEGNQHVPRDEGHYTWIEWMNKYGIGVNMEAMAGSPNEMFKLWRPKDMVTACRAVNITARDKLDDIDEVLDGAIAKFTIDMEHVASFGVEPWQEMDLLIEQEKWLADQDYDVKIDEDNPLAYMVRMYHLTKPGWETSQGTGHTHGPFRKGDKELYEWLYKMVEAGFGKNTGETAYVMYEVGGEQTGTVYQAQLAMDLIELNVAPEDLDPSRVDPNTEYENEEEALMARFFGMDRPNFNREWAKIEEHAFDPLDGLLQADGFDFTWSGSAAIEQGGNRPNEWKNEEFQ